MDEQNDCVFLYWIMAWCRLDICFMGGVSWSLYIIGNSIPLFYKEI